MRLAVLAAILSACLPAATLRAADYSHEVEFGLDLGHTRVGTADQDFEGTRGGVRFCNHYNRVFGLEGEWLVSSFPHDGFAESRDALLLNSTWNWRTSHEPNRARLIPYAVLGLGLGQSAFVLDSGTHGHESSLALRSGVGVRFLFGRHRAQGVRLEASSLRMDGLDGEPGRTLAVTLGYVGMIRPNG